MKAPNFYFEKKIWKKGFDIVAGVDEVGRGCFAGPVVCGCVVFDKKIANNKRHFDMPKIDDSKKLKPKEREIASKWIMDNALTWGIGEASVSLINKLGMAKATMIAFRRAISEANSRIATLNSCIQYLLIDAFYIPFIRGLPKQKRAGLKGVIKKKDALFFLESDARQLAIVDGDEKSFSIAAASIIAKVYRDKLMLRLSRKYPEYGWGRNKGYGTKMHQEAIKKYGLTKNHRLSFVKRFILKTS